MVKMLIGNKASSSYTRSSNLYPYFLVEIIARHNTRAHIYIRKHIHKNKF